MDSVIKFSPSNTAYNNGQFPKENDSKIDCENFELAVQNAISFKGEFNDHLVRFAKELHYDLVVRLDADRSVPDLTPKLQLELIFLLVAYKGTLNSYSQEITYVDFRMVLNKLEASEQATPEIKEAIRLYRLYDPETFLAAGVKIYNERVQPNFKLEMRESFDEMDRLCEATYQPKLNNDSVDVKVYWSAGMSSRQIYVRYPECRKDMYVPDDQKGFDYLKNTLGIEGPRMLEAIKSGRMTILSAWNSVAQIKLEFSKRLEVNAVELKEVERNWENLKNVKMYWKDFEILAQDYHYENKTPLYMKLVSLRQEKINLESKAVFKYVADGLLSIEKAVGLFKDQTIFLEMPAIQRSLDKFELAMQQVLDLPRKDNLNHGLYQYIDQGLLSSSDAAQLTHEQKARLNLVNVQMRIAAQETTVKAELSQ